MVCSSLVYGADSRPVKIFDCGANSLFMMCRISGKNVDYSKCLELLPIRSNGNSMLEMKTALEKIGFRTEALKIKTEELSNIKMPFVIWSYPPKDQMKRKDLDGIGHFLVAKPVEQNKIQIFDYPEPSVVIETDIWIKHLKSIKVDEFPVILCDNKDGKLSDMSVEKSCKNDGLFSPCQINELKSQITNDRTSVTIKENTKTDTLYWDFGNISEGAYLTKEFTITNGGNVPLEIGKLSKSCVCSSISSDKNIIEAGEQCKIMVGLSLAGKFNQQNISAAVIFDSKNNVAPVKILLAGYSHPRFLLEKPELNFGEIKSGVETEKLTTLIEATEYGLNSEIGDLKYNKDHIAAKIIKLDGNKYSLDVSFDSAKYKGRFDEKIEIFAKGQDKPVLECKLKGYSYSEYTIEPERLFLNGHQNPMAVLKISSRDGAPIKLLSSDIMEAESDSLDIRQLNEKPDSTLELAINPKHTQNKQIGKIKLIVQSVNSEISKEFFVPYFYPGYIK